MTTIICTLTKTAFRVEKIIKKHSDMPKSAYYYSTAYNNQEPVINIYRTPSGKLYAKQSPN